MALSRKILWLLLKNLIGFVVIAFFIILVCYLPTSIHVVQHQITQDKFVTQWGMYWKGVQTCLHDFTHFDFTVLHQKIRWGYTQSSELQYTGQMIWRSVTILVPGLLLGTLLGMLLGAGLFFLPRPVGRLLETVNRLLFSMPDILQILLIQMLAIYIDLSTGQYLIAIADYGSHQVFVLPVLCLALPVLCLALPILATVFHYSTNAYGEALSREYVQTVRAKGLPKGMVFFKHVVRPASDAVLAVFPKIAAFSVSSLVIVEKLFNIRGVSWWIDSKIMQVPNYPEILAILTIFMAILVTLITILTSLLRLWVNPTLRS